MSLVTLPSKPSESEFLQAFVLRRLSEDDPGIRGRIYDLVMEYHNESSHKDAAFSNVDGRVGGSCTRTVDQHVEVCRIGARIEASGLIANSSFQYLVLAVHAFMLDYGFVPTVPAKNSGNGFLPECIDLPKHTFLRPNWNVDPCTISLIYKWNTMAVQISCEDLLATTVLSMQTLCSVGVSFPPYVQISTEDFVVGNSGDPRLYQLQNENVRLCGQRAGASCFSLKRHSYASALTSQGSSNLFCTPPPRHMLSDLQPARYSFEPSMPTHMSTGVLSTVAALSRGSVALKRQRAGGSSTLLPPPPMHIPLHDDSLPGSVCSQHDVSSLSSKEDFLSDFAALTTPVALPFQKLPSFRDMFPGCGELTCADGASGGFGFLHYTPRAVSLPRDKNGWEGTPGHSAGAASVLPPWTELNDHLNVAMRQVDTEH